LFVHLILYTLTEHTFSLRGEGMPRYNSTERYVRKLYKSMSLVHPHQLTIEEVSKKLRIKIRYWDFPSEAVNTKGKYFIILNKSLNERERWQDFGHEITHILIHVGRQDWMHQLFIDLQEYQANYFAYHFCVPTFMLDDLKEVSICVIMDKFNVEEEFATRRFEMYENRRLDIAWREDMRDREVRASGN